MDLTGPDGRATSRKNLAKIMQRRQQGMTQQESNTYMQTVRNAVFAQFMTGEDFVKGGASLQLQYPLRESRASEDLDAVFVDSLESFTARLTRNLAEGWEGFTGEIIPKEHGPVTLMPTGSTMTCLRVRLFYKGKDFSSVDMEAVPDLNNCASSAARRMDEGNALLLEELGFQNVQAPRVIDTISQIVEKMDALSRPDSHKYRGRDLADIALLYKHEIVDYARLREVARRVEIAQGQHMIRMLDDGEKGEYEDSFNATGSAFSFDECWTITQRLLEQVDERQKGKWLL